MRRAAPFRHRDSRRAGAGGDGCRAKPAREASPYGGGSGGAQVPGTGNYIMLGGAGGAYLRLVVPLSSLAATQSVVVGAGGIGGGSTSGAGGNSSFNGFTAQGGRGGYSLQSSEPE